MNRKLILGIATFLAIVGMALVGAENEVEAGRGCGGGLLARLHAKKAAPDCGCLPPPPPAPVCPAPAPACPAPACEPACPPTCAGGLMAKLKAKHAARKAARKAKKCCPAPDPCCPAPAPEPCCAPAPAPEPCCAPAPAPEPCCGAPAPAPVMVAAPVAAAPCCGSDVMMSEAPMVEGATYGVPTEASPSDMGTSGAIMVNDRGEEIIPGSVQVVDDGAPAAPEAAVDAAVDAATDGI